jgi:ferredoxin
MIKRKIININEERCNGCGLCIPNCPEGAIQIIDGKARLISDLFCDGLGACIGQCSQGAIIIEERLAEPYDEKKVMENVVKQGNNVIKAHLEHLKEHNQIKYLKEASDFLRERKIAVPFEEEAIEKGHSHMPGVQGCPGSKVMDFREKEEFIKERLSPQGVSELRNWPIQIKLAPSNASYFENAELLIAADCVPFAYADFHSDLLKDKILLVGCPKLDDAAFYEEKITQMLKNNNIKSVICVHMEVPCCFGLVNIIKSAISASGKQIPFKEITIGIKGQMKT